MKVYRGEIDVKAVIDAGLAVRALERADPERVSSSDFIVAVGEGYGDWAVGFIDTLLDYIAARAQEMSQQSVLSSDCSMRGKR